MLLGVTFFSESDEGDSILTTEWCAIVYHLCISRLPGGGRCRFEFVSGSTRSFGSRRYFVEYGGGRCLESTGRSVLFYISCLIRVLLFWFRTGLLRERIFSRRFCGNNLRDLSHSWRATVLWFIPSASGSHWFFVFSSSASITDRCSDYDKATNSSPIDLVSVSTAAGPSFSIQQEQFVAR